ncbi:hypothetical protein WAQ86_004761 [Salmonella enterica]
MKGNFKHMCAVLISVALMSSPALSNDRASLLFKQAMKTDAVQVAKMNNISEDEALKLLLWQDAASQITDTLKTTYKSRLAGVYVESTPTNRIVVRLKGDQPVAKQSIAAASQTVAVDFQTGATHTLAELQAIRAAKLPELEKAFPELQGSATDQRTGEIVLDVYGTEDPQANEKASRIAGVPVKVRFVDGKVETAAVRGSGTIVTNEGDCTSGFVVRHTSTNIPGVLANAHCSNLAPILYVGEDGAVEELDFVAERWNASEDQQWYSSGTASFEPMFYADNWRTLTGRRLQSSTNPGDAVCHFGVTTRYSCGTVAETDYQPGSAICNGATCASTWVRVTPSTTGAALQCGPGDSGGPVFISTVAAGIMNGMNRNPSTGACNYMIYQSTDRISSLGLQLIY